jgi:hypothetical protein
LSYENIDFFKDMKVEGGLFGEKEEASGKRMGDKRE